MSLLDRIETNTKKTRLCTPGITGAPYDITMSQETAKEICAAEQRTAKLWGSEYAHYVSGGDTAVIASIYSVTNPGDEILVARNCSRAVYRALEIRCLVPHYITPGYDIPFGIYGSVTPESVETMLNRFPKSKAVVLQSPSSAGIISDIRGIKNVTVKYNVPLIADETYGAHLGFLDYFSGSAVKNGADITVHVPGTTLPCSPGAAVIHVNGNSINERVSAALDVFCRSPRPEDCIAADSLTELIKKKPSMFEKMQDICEMSDTLTGNLEKFRVLYGSADKDGHDYIYSFDKTKLLLSVIGTDMSGYALSKILSDSGIVSEYATDRYVLMVLEPHCSKQSLTKLAKVLASADKSAKAVRRSEECEKPVMPEQIMPSAYAVSRECESVFSGEADQRVSGEYMWYEKDGYPLIVPGEKIDSQIVDYALSIHGTGADLGTSDKSLKTIKVIR